MLAGGMVLWEEELTKRKGFCKKSFFQKIESKTKSGTNLNVSSQTEGRISLTKIGFALLCLQKLCCESLKQKFIRSRFKKAELMDLFLLKKLKER